MNESDQHGEAAQRDALSIDDQLVLDVLVESGMDAGVIRTMNAVDAARAQRLLHMLGLMNDYPVEDVDESLLDATMALVDREEAMRERRMKLDAAEAGGGRRRLIRLPDFISVAAVLLIGAAVFWPAMTQIRQMSFDAQCSENMRMVGRALASYGQDYNGVLPTAMAGPAGTWDTVANVLNLRPLIDQGYCEAGHLNCPGHRHQSGGYSYQMQLPGMRPGMMANPYSVVLGDRNPIIDAARLGELLPALTISANHGGRGQNVLHGDGSILWLTAPIVGQGDNIWLPAGSERLEKGAKPNPESDTFLAH